MGGQTKLSEHRFLLSYGSLGEDKSRHELKDLKPTRREEIIQTAWYTLMGWSTLMIWNVILNTQILFEITLWPGIRFGELILGSFELGAISSTIALIYLDRHSFSIPLARFVNLYGIFASCLLLIPIMFFAGVENASTAKGLICFCIFLLGTASGVLSCQSFAFATLFPRKNDQSNFISIGHGIAGVSSFAVFTICFELIFDRNSVQESQKVFLIMCILSCVVMCGSAVLLEMCISMPVLQAKIKEIKEFSNQKQKIPVEDKNNQEFFAAIKKGLLPAFRAGFCLFITILLFPMIGPLSWPVSPSFKNVNMGIFQILDMFFRFLPFFGDKGLLSVRNTNICVFTRPLLLLPFFLIPAYFPQQQFFANYYWLIFCLLFMVLSHSWGLTCSIVHCMRVPKNKKEAETIANVMSLFITSGVAIGAFSCKIPLIWVKTGST